MKANYPVSVSVALGALFACSILLLRAGEAQSETANIAGLTAIEKSRINLFQRTAPSVVHVAVQHASGGEYGAGIIWDSAGHVVTNFHVIKDATEIKVVLSSGEMFQAQLVAAAPNYDVAVLRVESRAGNLPAPLPIGQSSDLMVGQSIFAIGNPFGFDQTLTVGIISALRRRMRIDANDILANAVQLGASINPGDSGGPVLNSSGVVVAMTTATISTSGSGSGVAFAIPSETLKRVVPQLIQTGTVRRPTIGIVPAPDAKTVVQRVPGIAIESIVPGSPAERAGLKGMAKKTLTGDIITAASGRRVMRLADLVDELWTVGIGRPIELTVDRGEQMLSVELTLVDGSVGF